MEDGIEDSFLVIVSLCLVVASLASLASLFMTAAIYFRCVKHDAEIADAYLKDLVVLKHRKRFWFPFTEKHR